ncbi:MAG: hypothetical protein M0R17_04335 [Candidatus Omnitrophica bacterium]|jgi:hypothetical protein|nr:hypothetical protein [Candidatus Omnitrophota bacterium]
MRNIKELLQIVRDNIDKYFSDYNNGICIALQDLAWNEHISFEEMEYLEKFIQITKPSRPEWIGDRIRNGYGWEPGVLQPRLDYLDKYLSKSLEELEEILK